MATSDQTKQVNVRANVDLVDKIDRTLLQARAEGHLPMDYNRSDALRDAMRMIADDPSILSDYSEDGE